MNVFKNTKTGKKLILVIVLLILFNFCCPKRVNAGIGLDDIVAAPAQIFYALEKGVLRFLNDIFTNEEYHSEVTYSHSGSILTEKLTIALTPETIIKGKFALMDANIFKKIDDSSKYYDIESDGSGGIDETDNTFIGKNSLRDVVSGWYYALRNFAIVALLSVLVYVGIRMIISTVAQDKAKYKTMFKDWLIALCLLIFMHYIMIGILNISSLITDAVGGGSNMDHISELSQKISGILQEDHPEDDAPWFNSNSYSLDWTDPDTGETTKLTIGDAYAYILVLFGIIIFTFIFAVKYLKREFTIIFLILLGPISCITYPIDKISDGKAQAFNRWFSEFLYQVIIQPFHLLLYIVLVGSATELATSNVIYTLVCFAMMIPAEKFIKEMFGFKDKLGSPLGAFAGGAMAHKALNALMNKEKGAITGGKDGKGDNDSPDRGLPPKTVDKDSLTDGNGGSGNSNTQTLSESATPTAIGGSNSGDSTADDDVENQQLNVATEKEQLTDGQSNEENLAEQQKELLGMGDGREQDDVATGNNSKNSGDNKKNIPQQSFMKSLRATRNQRVSKRWGSTSRKQRWKNRGKKAIRSLPGLAKGAAKGAAIGILGAAAVSGALLTGNGKEALGIAGAVGAYAGKYAGSKAWKGGKRVIKGATGAVKGYYGNLRDDEQREKKAFRDFEADKAQQDKASYSFMKRNGYQPGYKELKQEMKDRFDLSRYGLSDDQIDESIESYQKLKESGVSEKDALNQTVFANQLANKYKGKFGKKKDMTEAVEAVTKTFTDQDVPKEIAERNARKYLQQAADMKEETIVLPENNQTLDINAPTRDAGIFNSLGLNQADLEEQELQQISNLNIRLHDAGYDDSQIRQIASTIANSGSSGEVIDNFENIVNASVKYIDDGKARSQAESLVRGLNAGGKAPKSQVDAEMRERFVVKSTMGVKKEEDISALRDLETEVFETKTDREVARQVANQHRGKLRAGADMTAEKQKMITKLVESGSSQEKAKRDVENIFDVAAVYADPNQNRPKTSGTSKTKPKRLN